MRLVAKGYQTKEIAKDLGISVHHVNRLIFEGRTILGGLPRRAAGRLFADWEARRAPQTEGGYLIAPQPMGLHKPDEVEPTVVIDHDAEALGLPVSSSTDAQASFGLTRDAIDWRRLMALRRSGRQINDLTFGDTLLSIAVLTIGALVAIGSAVTLLSSLNSLVQSSGG